MVLIILFFTCFGIPVPAQQQTELMILHELRIMHSMLMDLKADMAQMKQEMKNSEKDDDDDEDDDFPTIGSFKTRKASTAKLRKIKLPKNPNKAQIEKYIQAIMSASRTQNSFSSGDPQIQMLTKVGAENLKFLITALGKNAGRYGFSGKFHVREAIYKLAEDKHKNLIIKFLPQYTSLVKIILDRGWEKDAKKILVEELSSTSQNLPTEWIQAVANLNDPKTYKDLKWFLVNNSNRYRTFQAIQHLPGIDLNDSVAEAWQEGGQNEWERRGMAKVAIQYGHLDALEYLVDYLNSERSNRWEMTGIRQQILRYINFHKSNKEIAQWLKKNEGKIIFDKKIKKFIVPDTKKASN